MQRRPPTEMSETVREQCIRLADVADPADSTVALAVKVADLSKRQVQRRLEAMERDLGLGPAAPDERGGGRWPRDGERQHSRPYRRAGTVARQWKRLRAGDCL